MSEFIERVARAVFEDFMDWQFGQPLQWEGTPPANAKELEREWRDGEWREQREYHVRVVLAALRAMSAAYPPEPMIIAGHDALLDWDARTGDDLGIANIFRAMVDAALSQDTLHSISPDPQLLVGSDGSPSTLSSEAGGAKMAGVRSASPDRAANADISNANSERAVTNLSSSAEPPRGPTLKADGDHDVLPIGASPSAAQFPE